MRHSTDRILVSHAGNLPRPAMLDELIDGGRNTSQAGADEYHKRLPEAVKWIVDKQIELGIDVVNDGEYPKAGSYGGYINTRMQVETEPVEPGTPPVRAGAGGRDAIEFPGTAATHLWLSGSGGPNRPGFIPPAGGGGGGGGGAQQRRVVGPVKYIGQEAAKEDVANLKAAIAGKNVEGIITSLGPLSYGSGRRQSAYPSHEAWMQAVAEQLREEYKIITDSGLNLQMDEPNFCTTWSFYPDWDIPQLRSYLEQAVEIINYSLAGIPEEQVRFHTCWGSGHRPHVNDIEFKYIADIMLKIKAQMYSVEAANVRHRHEWTVWKDIKLPAGKILQPGVLAHATDLVEHPDAIAELLTDYASVVGKENVQTGTDCGIGSRVGHEELVWAKLEAMSEGARRASQQLWGR